MFKKPVSEHQYRQCIDIIIPSYNVRQIIERCVKSTLMQELPIPWVKNIIIVDDGSSDGTGRYCKALFQDSVIMISHEKNRGRSATCNTGWKSGSGQFVVFLDADCEWRTTGSLAAHLGRILSGADVSSGSIIGRDRSFWSMYQNVLQSSRATDFSTGNRAAFTSANVAVRRSILEAVGGFDEEYRHYGFEDRDFLLRLIMQGAKVSYCQEAEVITATYSSLMEVCRKMMESGKYSSLRFQMTHPEFYMRTSYGKIDCGLHGFPFTTMAAVAEPLVPALSKSGDKLIANPHLPFVIKKALVKLMSGLAYMIGTYRRDKNQ